MTLPQIATVWYLMFGITLVGVIIYPLILAAVAQRRLQVSWRYFFFGALIFFLFQVITRVPLVVVLGQVWAPAFKASAVLRYVWLTALALTAGIFEEVGRYFGYRWFLGKEEKTWSKAIMYGIGHGGLESILLVGVGGLLTLVNLLVISSIGLSALPASSQAAVHDQFAAIAGQPGWFPLLGLWERLWTVPVHIALSVVVLQVFRRGSLGWLWLAIGLHALLDLVTVLLAQSLPAGVGTSLLIEVLVAVAGGIAIWGIWRLRDQPGVIPPPATLASVAA